MHTEPATNRSMTSESVAPRVLVVDDESTIRHVLQSLLEEHRCTVCTADSAEQGLEMVLGVINATNRRAEREFSTADLDYLTGLAGQLAVAIERTSHFEDLQTAYESLEAAQEQLVRSERLKALGEMAVGVAHDFNNSLSVILGRAEFALRRKQQGAADNELVAELKAIRKVARQSVDTIRRIQDYTHIRKDSPDTTLQLNEVIRDVVEMTRPKWQQERAAVTAQGRRRYAALQKSQTHREGNQAVQGDHREPAEIRPTGEGRVQRDRHHHGGGGRRRHRAASTGDEGRQAGLGLSVSFGIIRDHQGHISVQSELGEGTTFIINVPLHQVEEGKPARESTHGQAPEEPKVETAGGGY